MPEGRETVDDLVTSNSIENSSLSKHARCVVDSQEFVEGFESALGWNMPMNEFVELYKGSYRSAVKINRWLDKSIQMRFTSIVQFVARNPDLFGYDLCEVYSKKGFLQKGRLDNGRGIRCSVCMVVLLDVLESRFPREV